MAQTTQPKPTIIAKPGEKVIAMPAASPEQIAALTVLRMKAVDMITSLELGSGCNKAQQTYKVSPPVTAFQARWNHHVPLLRPLFSSANVAIGPLVVDGKYGRNTAAAVWLCLVDPTGLMQADMPTHPCTFPETSAEPFLDKISTRLNLRLVQALAPKPKPKPAPKPTPSKPVADTMADNTSAAYSAQSAATVSQGQGGGSDIVLTQPSDVTFEPNEVAPVAGTTSKGMNGWVYALIGAGVFGLGYAWWKWGGKK